MKTKLLLSAAAGAIALSGLGFNVANRDDPSGQQAGAPFLHPLIVARSLCGENPDGLAKRRQFFVRMASAYADALNGPVKTDTGLYENLGQISYDISTEDPDAQAWFNQGLAFTYGFNHHEAIRAFQRAQAIDADCAMCFWGEALAYGPNINAPMGDDAVAPAYAALTKAQSLGEGASDKEKALINALSYRYSPAPLRERAKLDNAFADAMDQVALDYPEDDFIAVLAAEANMDTQPWDYWEDGGRTPKGRTARTISLIEGVLARSPQHTAAIHLYIHMTEASQNPYRAAAHADRLAALTPGLGHLIHMPSHTYYRVGRFEEALDHNIQAVAADEAYLGSAEAGVLYKYGYYTHNIHFAMTSAQMSGDGQTALAMAEKLDQKLPIEMASAAPFVQPIKAAPLYAMVQYGDPETVLALEKPSEEFPFLQGIWHYARAEALARTGDVEGAEAETAAIAKIVSEADLSPLTDNNVPALDILNIARLTATARAAAAAGSLETAIEAMEEAVALQDAIAYTEPPYWYYPAKQTLASLVLQNGEPARAEQLFLESLAASPNNAFVLYGLSEAYRQTGDRNGAKFADNLFKDAWLGAKKPKMSLSQL